MPTLVLRPEKDPLKRYKWAALGLILMAGGVAAVLMLLQRQGGGGLAEDRQLAASEQSLDSLEAAALASGEQAPGIPLNVNGPEGPYAKKTVDISNPESMLYQSPAPAPGSPVSAKEASALKNAKNGSSLAQALNQVAHANKKQDAKGWGGEAARTGFSVPKANFGAISGLGSSGGGSGARYSSSPTAYGSSSFGSSSGNSGVVETGSASGGNLSGVHQGTNQNLNYLRNAEALATQAATASKADQMAGLAGKSFDATSTKPILASSGGGTGAAGISDDAVPGNLKADDPSLSQKQLKAPPAVPDPKQVMAEKQAEAQLEQQKQMESIMISAAIGGVAGPIFGGVGSGIASSMGLAATSGVTSMGNDTIAYQGSQKRVQPGQ